MNPRIHPVHGVEYVKDSFAIDVAANVLVRMLPDDKVSELNDLFKMR